MVINGVLFHTFLIFANSRSYMNEPLKRTNCLQKSFDSVCGWDKRMDAPHLSVSLCLGKRSSLLRLR